MTSLLLITEIGLRLNAPKCRFFQIKVECLGYQITPSGVSPTQERVKNVVEAPAPKNKSELKSFLGIITFNAKFLPDLSTTVQLRCNFILTSSALSNMSI